MTSESASRSPGKQLENYVVSYGGYKFPGTGLQSNRITPSTHLTLLVSLNGNVSVTNAIRRQSRQSHIGGLHDSARSVESSDDPFGLRVAVNPQSSRRLFGVSPKKALQLTRFEHACALFKSVPTQTISTVASRAGFADQAHLTRTWQTLNGCTLSTWLNDEFPFLQDYEFQHA